MNNLQIHPNPLIKRILLLIMFYRFTRLIGHFLSF